MTKFSCLDVVRAAGLEEGRRRGKEQPFRCPRHGDEHPSLKVNLDKNVWICGPCGQKGTAWQLAAFLSNHDPADKPPVTAWLREHGLLSGNGRRATASPKRTIACTYAYRDAHGELQYEDVRFTPKDFRPRRPDGRGDWIWDLEGVQRVPYALERLVDSTPEVFVPEGEKDCETLWSQHVPATCNIGGAGQPWLDSYSEQLKTVVDVRRAYILPDHDVPGHRHAQQAAASLHRVGIEVRVVTLPGLHDGPPASDHGRDISHWLETHTIAELKARAAETPIWTPTSPAMPSHWQRLDLAELATWPCEPLRPIVDQLFALGNLVYLAAESQTGKSLLALYVAQMCLHGGRLFDRFTVTPINHLMYAVLEDPARRIHDRLLDMQRSFPTPLARARCLFYVAPGFTLTEDRFWQWFEHTIVSERHQLVILDTYQKATPGLESFDDKAQGPILHRLSEMTRRLNVTIVVIDHLRKQPSGAYRRRGDVGLDDIKGSGGKAQNADTVILLARTPDRRDIRFQCFSKDFDDPARLLLRVAPKGSPDRKFTCIGDLDALGSDARARGAATRQRVLEAMPLSDWISVPDLATRLGLSRSAVIRHVRPLLEDGQVLSNEAPSRYRRYCRAPVTPQPTDTQTARETDGSDKPA